MDPSLSEGPSARGSEVPLLRNARRPTSRGFERVRRVFRVPRHLEKVASHGVEQMVTRDSSIGVDRGEKVETGTGPEHHSRSDGSVDRRHRIRGDPIERLVEREDLRPVRVLRARRFVVHGSDRCLKLIRADWPRSECFGHKLDSLADEVAVPAVPILVGQRDEVAGWRRACRTASLGENQQAPAARLSSPSSGRRIMQPARPA